MGYEHALKNAYIWKYPETRYTPWANTIAYYPLTSVTQTNDMKWSWTPYNLVSSGTVTYTWVWWVSAIDTTSWYLTWTISNIPLNDASRTISVWAYLNSNTWNAFQVMWYYWWRPSLQIHHTEQMMSYQPTIAVWCLYLANFYDDLSKFSGTDASDPYKWYNIIYTYDWTTQNIYLNWVQFLAQTISLATSSNNFYIWRSNQWTNFPWYLSELIIEDIAWSSQDVANYYDFNKSYYE